MSTPPRGVHPTPMHAAMRMPGTELVWTAYATGVSAPNGRSGNGAIVAPGGTMLLTRMRLTSPMPPFRRALSKAVSSESPSAAPDARHTNLGCSYIPPPHLAPRSFGGPAEIVARSTRRPRDREIVAHRTPQRNYLSGKQSWGRKPDIDRVRQAPPSATRRAT